MPGRFMLPPQVVQAYAVDPDALAASDSRPRTIQADSRRLEEHQEWAKQVSSGSGQIIVGPLPKPVGESLSGVFPLLAT